MTLKRALMDAIEAAKKAVLENLELASEKTGESNPFGDKTLVLDKAAEESAIDALSSSGIIFAILTEEQGMVMPDREPEYLAVLDPIDGSTNLERGIPLCSVGISAVPYSQYMTTDDIEISIIDSFFTPETYVAETGKGVKRNGKAITVREREADTDIIVSYDTKKDMRGEFGTSSLRTLEAVYDIRRTGSNLLDLCWTAAGALDAMIDLRNILPIVHASGTHMVIEAGGYVIGSSGSRFRQDFDMSKRMSFIAASNESLAKSLLSSFIGQAKLKRI